MLRKKSKLGLLNRPKKGEGDQKKGLIGRYTVGKKKSQSHVA